MKSLKIFFLFFHTIVIASVNIGTIPIINIANASNFSDTYYFRLKLDEPLPFKVYSLNNPNRIVLELDTSVIRSLDNLEVTSSPLFGDINVTKIVDGWSTISIKIDTPVKVRNLAIKPQKLDSSKVELSFELFPIEQQEFDRIVTLFEDDALEESLVKMKKKFYDKNNNNLTVVIDPGHGGVLNAMNKN